MYWFSKKKKKKNAGVKTILSPGEQLLILNEEKKTRLNQLEYAFERKERSIKETYQKRLAIANSSEKNLSFQTIIFEADNGKHPLIYEVTRSNPYAQYYLLSRGKFTPNPYKIEISNHKNVLFLRAFEGEQSEEPFIFLHYDKINDKYTEYGWSLSSDYVEKYQIKSFLYELMKTAHENRMEHCKKVKSHYAAFFAFERTLESKSFQWKEELKAELQAMAAEQANETEKLMATYRAKALAFEKEKEKKNKEKQMLAYQRQLALEEELAFDLPQNSSVAIPNVMRAGQVFDQETHRVMTLLFQRVYGLLHYEQLLDVYAQHDLTSLYQKDIQELWYGFIKLDEEAQSKEKNRFIFLLDKIHLRLDCIEDKLEQSQNVDYEKKMAFLENKYS